MIVGRGRIAQALARTSNTGGAVYYANGSCVSPMSWWKEEADLLNYFGGHVVYFSTVTSARYDYGIHKRRMETVVRDAGGIVFRLTNVIARWTRDNGRLRYNAGNVGALDKAFHNALDPWVVGTSIDLNPMMNPVDVDDIAQIVTRMVPSLAPGSLVEIVGPDTLSLIAIFDIIANEMPYGHNSNTQRSLQNALEQIKKFEPKYIANQDLQRPTFDAAPYGVDFSDGYVHRVLEKYYGPMLRGQIT